VKANPRVIEAYLGVSGLHHLECTPPCFLVIVNNNKIQCARLWTPVLLLQHPDWRSDRGFILAHLQMKKPGAVTRPGAFLKLPKA
jgi:hypothetical protein